MTTQTVYDPNIATDWETPLWSETRWHCCWSPDSGVGVYMHAGRFRKQLDMWWVHVAAFLPDGRLAVDRHWTRNGALAGVKSENLDLTMTETGWHAAFDGVGELTSTEGLSRAPRGASAPSVAMRWDVTATNAAPVWDMYDGVVGLVDFASDMHYQQGSRTSGTLWVDGREYALEGIGFKDHSSGVRNWANWHSHRFLLAVMPDYVLHASMIMSPDGSPKVLMGVLLADGEKRPVEAFEAPVLADAQGHPYDQELLVTGPEGPMTVRCEFVHALPIVITDEDNDNFNGINWELPGDPLVMIEGIVRVTQPDGTIGYAFLERSARRSALPPPTTR